MPVPLPTRPMTVAAASSVGEARAQYMRMKLIAGGSKETLTTRLRPSRSAAYAPAHCAGNISTNGSDAVRNVERRH